MKHYRDPEARQTAMDNLNHQASLRHKVSTMEEVSVAKEMEKGENEESNKDMEWPYNDPSIPCDY